MKTALYVFSATGNCLSTARKLAAELPDCTIFPVASFKDAVKVTAAAQNVGFVFPVYYGNMPYPVRALVSKMVFLPDSYIFSVTTYRGHEGKAPQRLDQLLRTRGEKLSLAVGLKMPGNSFLNEIEVDNDSLAHQDENIAAILPAIQEKRVEDLFTDELLPLTPVGCPNNFRGITADENCVGCGRCVTVCPMGNIKLVDGKAVIGDDCATCLACFHWCPNEAIWMSKEENIARRRKYRHPEVTLEDIQAEK